MTTLVDGGVEDGTVAAAPDRSMRLPSWVVPLLVGGIVAFGVVLRFVQRSPLWLDEALSVNIAKLSVPDLLSALRHDGHPPLYYLILHYWMKVFGQGDEAVRALSGILSVATLPVAWVAGKRLAGRSGGRWALVVVALSPYCIRYGTETRMYALVMLLVLVGYLVLTDALDQPTWGRLAVIAAVTGLLLLSHYWSFYLLASVGLLLLVRLWRQPAARGTTLRILGAMAAGSLLFLPWLGGFLYQSANTGTPWGQPFRPTAIVEVTLRDLGGGELTEAGLYGSAVLILLLITLFAVRTSRREITLDVRTAPTMRRELAVTLLVLTLGAVAGFLTNATYQSRYAAVIVPLVLLAVAVGFTRVPNPARLAVGIIYVGLSLAGIVWVNYYQRSQSAVVGAAVAANAKPGDLVVYCPDQLGPDYSREVPAGLRGLSYPALTSPERVDWVDYAARNAKADPAKVAQQIKAQADGHAIFLVWMPAYRTLEGQCEALASALGVQKTLVMQDNTRYFEPAYLQVVPAK
jgi:mannosyltransferase